MAKLQAAQPVLEVKDVTAAVLFYEHLGFLLAFVDLQEDPKYAGVRRDGVELHLQWHDASEWADGKNGRNYRFTVDDVDGLSEEFNVTGLALDRTAVWDTAWGTREFHLRDLDGNGLQFYRHR